MLRLEEKKQDSLEISLDWQAYYGAFKQLHGDPVEYHGRLLFRDGWMYSSTRCEGPEWAPPEDGGELKTLVVAYWTVRKEVVQSEMSLLDEMIGKLREVQDARSAPLQHSVLCQDDETKRRWMETGELDYELMQERANWLQADVQECNENIGEGDGSYTQDER